MLLEKILFCFFFLHLVNSQLQINLHLTDWINEVENLQHDCLHVPVTIKEDSDPRQIITYCMSELSSKFDIKENNLDQKLTFDDLSKQHITSEQLYLWSAPIDLVEKYQFYLNQLQNSEKTSLGGEMFYNCTLPYFGPKCQYRFFNDKSSYSTFNEIIHDYYYYNRYEPTLFTCYIHLECNRGAFPSCLDWTEICDGKVDCLDSGYDEEHCWQLEINQCNDNEYQCSNGQCIPKAFFNDDSNIPDCLDQSDDVQNRATSDRYESFLKEPSFRYDDVMCIKRQQGQKFSYFDFSFSSCIKERQDLLLQAIFSIKPKMLSNECWTAMKCSMQMPIPLGEICRRLCSDEICNTIIQKTCPDVIIVPAIPILFGHVYLAYEKSQAHIINFRPTYPQYICYDPRLLHLPIDDETLLSFNNIKCHYPPNDFFMAIQYGLRWGFYVKEIYELLLRFPSLVSNDPKICNRSNMYHCINSLKCISKGRLYDGVVDCVYQDDEGRLVNEDDEAILLLNKNCSTEQTPNYFQCVSTNECISRNLVQNNYCDCTRYDDYYCDDEDFDRSYAWNTISFQTICDGFTHLSPKFIEDQNETDETNCEHWPLIHIYNHCDGFWHISNGSDELYCESSPVLNCSSNDHICVSPKTNELMCLPIEKANDGIIDCLGAADEPKLCPMNQNYDNSQTFFCENEDNMGYCAYSEDLCNVHAICLYKDDERACKPDDITVSVYYGGICKENYESVGSDVAKILCRRFDIRERWRVHFTLDQSRNSIRQNVKDGKILSYATINKSIESYQPRCHRGLDFQVWLDKENNLTKKVCFCPPSYYGDNCQYQNQRISLTLQFHVTSDSLQIPFVIIVSLIDNSNERLIHSSEQLTHLSVKHCQRKYNIYLLYSTRPKDEMKEYSLQIYIYEKKTLNYRGSIIKSLNYSFLPVHRLSFQLNIPRIRDNIENCLDNNCINGKCVRYSNDSTNRTFCQCSKGWSGRYCTIEYHCNCSFDSLCLGKFSNNRSLCLCPLTKMGPRCLMNDNICQNNKSVTCFNGGQCIPVDEYQISTKRFICICQKGFSGDQCEIVRTKLIILFDKNINLSSSIFIHFIEVKLNAPPVRTTTLKTILNGQDSIIIYWSLPFHIVFIELTNQSYYFILMEKIHKQSLIIERRIYPSHRCLHINELFNETIANSSLLNRIKYYHLPCQTNSSELSCFYDEIHFCLCQQLDQQLNQQRVANCFEFNHQMNLYCSDENVCQNSGTCFQEFTNCPRISICHCPVCYYGTRCQLSTNGFSLSIDAIIGYHILPNLNISHQPYPVLISLIITVIITFLGLVNGILSIITFKNKSTRESGCGIYLLTSSIITLLLMIVFLLKFFILLFTQMGSIQNRLFLNIQCHSIDFLLRFCLTMDQWLTALVAIERAFVIIKKTRFNKKKSKSISKWIIMGLVLLTILTNIFDPIYRSLFEENDDIDEERRIWCIVQYPSAIYILNLVITILHFVVPFIINIICAIIIILMSTRQQAITQKKQTYKEILKKQVEKHKNLLIGPSVLIILGIPRLVISLTSGCMKSSTDSWLFLLGYYISLIPPLLTFILFVLPSSIYKEAFREAINQYRNIIRRR